MKLLNKTGLYYIAGSAIVFIIGGFIFYHFLNTEINDELSQKLWEKKFKIEKQLASLDTIPSMLIQADEPVQFVLIDPSMFSNSTSVSNTFLFNPYEEEIIPYRQLKFYAKTTNAYYQVTVSKSLMESEDLAEAIGTGLIIMFLIFLVFSFLLNRLISGKIWKPFFINLNSLKEFDLANQKTLELKDSNIDEFRQLNTVIQNMTGKMQKDYRSLKEFTENAAHEIQTPLAIIKTRIELLIQSGKHNAEEMATIQSVYEAASRLSKLNQALLLLTKIENLQFGQKEKVNLSEMMQKHLSNYAELIEAKEISLSQEAENNVSLSANPVLADTLISNLLMNAIKHNINKGEIKIKLSRHALEISNTGIALQTDPSLLFDRFKKDKTDSESLGLGLSIVKKVCEAEGIDIRYDFQEQRHTLSLRF